VTTSPGLLDTSLNLCVILTGLTLLLEPITVLLSQVLIVLGKAKQILLLNLLVLYVVLLPISFIMCTYLKTSMLNLWITYLVIGLIITAFLIILLIKEFIPKKEPSVMVTP